MERFYLTNDIPRVYANNGQHAEQKCRYNMTGEIAKADHTPFNVSADCGLYQIKSARASICKGTDLDRHLEQDAAERYAYVIKDFSMAYLMSKDEYREFATKFATVTYDSAKNGKAAKMRFGHETRAMREYLEAHVA